MPVQGSDGSAEKLAAEQSTIYRLFPNLDRIAIGPHVPPIQFGSFKRKFAQAECTSPIQNEEIALSATPWGKGRYVMGHGTTLNIYLGREMAAPRNSCTNVRY
eukprot:scaffold341_cov368-Pavlova_lutheri.AAC.7